MEALLNDHQCQLDILLTQEPSIIRTHISAWPLYRPTVESESVRFQSLGYASQRILEDDELCGPGMIPRHLNISNF